MKIHKIDIPKELLIISVFAVALSLARVAIYGTFYYMYLVWNISLAFIPFLISFFLLKFFEAKKIKKYSLLCCLFIWFFFFPNAPYLVTDLIHVGKSTIVPVWYDGVLVFVCAWAGILISNYSLEHIFLILNTRYTRRASIGILSLVIFFASIGIYIGRFLRWNSWDILSHPFHIAKQTSKIFFGSDNLRDPYLFVALMFCFVLISFFAHIFGKNKDEK